MLRLSKIYFQHPGKFKLSNISLKINAGEINGMIGESGSGKTTLLKLMANEISPMDGEVILDNEKLTSPQNLLIKGHPKIKVVSQSNNLFPNISVFENVAYELRFFKQSYLQKRCKDLFKMFNISHLKDRLPRELSGGELQRVRIAKAIADEPKVLLLDEPFSNLDILIKKQILRELIEVIRIEKIACVFVTHEISDALGLVDQMIILRNGKIIQKGLSEELYFKPKNLYVANLLSDGFWIEEEAKYYRPENFIIDENGVFDVKVESTVFKGFYFEIYFNYRNTQVFCRSTNKLSLNSTLKISILKGIEF